MIRPFTCLCLLLAGGSGLYLYQEKHRTQMLDREIGRVIHETEATRGRIGALKAEWAVRTEPGRLSDLATRFLALKPMAPTQFVQLADLAGHLPAVGPMPAGVPVPSPEPPGGPGALPLAAAAPAGQSATMRDAAVADEDDPAAPSAATAGPSPDARQAAPPPVSEAAGAQDVGDDDAAVSMTPAEHPKPAAKASALAAAHPHRPAELQIARAIDAGRPTTALAHGGLLPLATARPSAVRVLQAAARPGSGSRAAALPRMLQPQSASFVGSSLGGAASLPPAVPYSGQ